MINQRTLHWDVRGEITLRERERKREDKNKNSSKIIKPKRREISFQFNLRGSDHINTTLILFFS